MVQFKSKLNSLLIENREKIHITSSLEEAIVNYINRQKLLNILDPIATATIQDLESASHSDLIHTIKSLKKENQQLKQVYELPIISENSHVTEIKEIIERLTESQEQLSSTFSSIDDDVYVFDKNHQLISSNVKPNKVSFLTTSHDRCLGQYFSDIFPEVLSDKLKAALHHVAETHEVQQFEHGLLNNLASLYFKISVNHRKDSAGKYTGFTMVARDITEEKIADKKIIESEKKYRSVVESVREVIFQTDIWGKWSFLNPAWKEMSGHDIYVSLEQPIVNFIHKDDKPSLNRLFQRIIQGKKDEARCEIRFIDNQNKVFWADIFIKVYLDDSGKVAGTSGTLNDITKRKKAEETLKEKNQELVKTNEELDRFVYSASHDLRAPLASTLGLINISRLSDDETERAYYLDLMEQSLNRMDKIIQDLTDYSRNTRLEIKTEEINFEHMIKDIFQRLKYLKNIDDVRVNTQIEAKGNFYSDKIRLYIILINILSNAIKYQKYEQSYPFISINITIDAKKAIIAVKDNGIGIDKSHIDKIFTMFFQVSRDSVGSGLGLYIAKETVNKLHGSITVESIVSKGSTFTITIPNAKSYIYEAEG